MAAMVTTIDLKAALRAHVRTQDIRSILEASSPYLPPELIDMIVPHVFDDLHNSFRRKWGIIHACIRTSDQRQVVLTLHRRLCNTIDNDVIRAQEHDTLCTSCRDTAAAWHHGKASMQTRVLDAGWPLCGRCHRKLKRDGFYNVRTPWLDTQRDDVDYEDDMVDSDDIWGTPQTFNVPESALFMSGKDSWYRVQRDLAVEWEHLLKEGLLFTNRERTLLASLGLQIESQSTSPRWIWRAETTGLVLQGFSQRLRMIIAGSTVPIETPGSREERKLAIRRALSKLRLR